MSSQSEIGKQAWRDRAPGYAAGLRGEIEHDSRARFEGWQRRGRPPAWFRVKRGLCGGPVRRAGGT